MSADIYITNCCAGHGHNITHNLGQMFRAAGLDWRDYKDADPEVTALALGRNVREALSLMRSDPERFRQFDAPNGWGTYEHALQFLEELAASCERHPDGKVGVSL